jgi:hypothetical protein
VALLIKGEEKRFWEIFAFLGNYARLKLCKKVCFVGLLIKGEEKSFWEIFAFLGNYAS